MPVARSLLSRPWLAGTTELSVAVAADPGHSVPEADRRLCTAAYARPGRMRAGIEYFHAFTQDARNLAVYARTPLHMPMRVLVGEKVSAGSLPTRRARPTPSCTA